jgi:Ca-activated chloride channel family protein
MDFLWPGFFFLRLLLPLLVVLYLWMQRRRRQAVRYSSLSLLREALPRQSRLRRHIPFVLLLLGLTGLILALTRPVSIAVVPTDQTTVLLSIDVSRSMCQTDIVPSRIEAAQAAALSFVEKQDARRLIGVVAFSGFAEVIQAPTADKAALQAAIESLTTGRRTAIGSGLLKALDAIAEVDENVAASVTDPALEPPPVAKGAYAPDIIVLLTDGVTNAGPLPLDAAQQAANRGVRVYTIGFGTAAGDGGSGFPSCSQRFMGSEPNFGGGGFGGFGGGGFGGPGGFRRGIDEETLKQVSALTGGTYYSAESADELQKVFANLPTSLIVKHQTTEISVFFTAFGALLLMLAVLLGLLWHPLP